jgi:hypothetical protein
VLDRLGRGSSCCHQLDDAVDRRLVPVGEPVDGAAPALGQAVDIDARGDDDPPSAFGTVVRPSGETLGLTAAASPPQGADDGPVSSTVHDQTSPSPGLARITSPPEPGLISG